MDDDDDDLDKRRQILQIFRDKFQSATVQQHHQTYIDRLHDILNQWKSEINDKIKQFVKDKTEEIDELYDQYCEEFNDKYADVKQVIETNDNSLDIDDQIQNFNTYCQSNTIENCIRLQTKLFTNDQLAETIQLDYIVYPELPSGKTIESLESSIEERRIEPLESPVKEKLTDSFVRKDTVESPVEERIVESLKSPVRESTTESLINHRTVESPVEERIVESLKSPVRESTTESLINHRTVESPPVEERTSEPSTKSVIRKRTVESPDEERTFEPLKLSTEKQATEQILESPVEEQTTELTEASIIQRPIEAIKLLVRPNSESIYSSHTSSRGSPPIPVQNYSTEVVHKDKSLLKRRYDPSNEEPVKYNLKSIIRKIDDDEPKTLTRLYVGKHDVLTPVLVGKDREIYNETEKITEYSIDSIPIPVDRHEQSLDPTDDSDNEMKIVRAYRVFIKEESDYQQYATSSSDHDEEDDDDDIDEELSNINHKFNLKKFDQINYSTIMFRKCETNYNCLSSSTKRNELILYNSKLKVLVILQHENHEQCRHRFYLHWPKNLSSNISDITYCEPNDSFLISTHDTCQIYLFDRHLLSIIDLGQLSNDSSLRRIHCYQQIIYCIIANNYLLEYELINDYSQLNIIRKIKLFNPIDQSQDTSYYLLDITCDENYLIIIYSNEHDEIRLQSIYRQTRLFHQDILLDIRQPINQNYIRIESTYFSGHFIYLNGSQQHLKAIDLVTYNKGKITSIMRRHTKPTNICFLSDKRLVILYEQPYFLSVHDLNNPEKGN